MKRGRLLFVPGHKPPRERSSHQFWLVYRGRQIAVDPSRGIAAGPDREPDLKAEFNGYVYKRGTVGAARSSSPNSANSQFFICFDNQGCRSLTGQYTVWGQVVQCMEHVDKIKRGEPVRDPDKIFCVGVNYRNRNEEYRDGSEAPKYPSLFMRTRGRKILARTKDVRALEEFA